MTENNGNVEKETLESALKKEFGSESVKDLADDLSTVKIDGKQYSINGKTAGGGNQDGDDDDDALAPGKKATTTAKDNYTDTSESKKKATIPAGFTVSNIDGEKNVDDGLVIYLIPDGETPDWTTKATGDNFAENTIYDIQTKYDQFVWVPVSNINNMVMCKNNNKDGHTCNIQLNSQKTSISCTANGANEENEELCGKLYWDVSNWVYQANKTNQTWTDDSGLREPDFVKDYDNSPSYNNGVISLDGDNGIKSEFLKMATSVAKYGGFWVGRYESSLVINKTRQLAGQTSMNASQDTSKMWYGLYTRQKNFASDNSITGSVASQMICGSQYDAMMNWMAGDSIIDVTAYPPKSDVIYNTSRVTGATKNGSDTINDKLKNVYDLTGNSFEWTQEAGSTGNRVSRGGCFSDSYSPSYRIGGNPTGTGGTYGSRLSLYVK